METALIVFALLLASASLFYGGWVVGRLSYKSMMQQAFTRGFEAGKKMFSPAFREF